MSKAAFLCFSTILMTISMSSTLVFILEQTPQNVSFGERMSLKCSIKGSGQDLTSVNWLRITKNLRSSWTKVAELRDIDSCVSIDQAAGGQDDVSATGQLGNAGDTYLKMTWKSASLNILGNYRCELVGHTRDGGISVVSTPAISLTGDVTDDYCQRNGDISAELSFLRKEVKELSNILRSIYERETSMVQNVDSRSSQGSLSQDGESKVTPSLDLKSEGTLSEDDKSKVTSSQDDKFKITLSRRDELANFSFENLMWHSREATERFPDESSQQAESVTFKTSDIIVTSAPRLDLFGQWPGGSYALLVPETGCPENTSDVFWHESFSRHHVESDTGLPVPFGTNHVAKPLYETQDLNRFVFFRLCLAKGRVMDGNSWPKGTYCISRLGSLCPKGGFSSGYIQLDDENNVTERVHSNFMADVEFLEGVTRLHFCCRRDEDHMTPIILPTELPFYLYRYGGECQNVTDMKFTQETLIFDTEDEANMDSYENSFHPDGRLDDVNIHLCYYENARK